MSAADGPGPLEGLRVLELAGEWCAHAGRLLGELGADVTLVEPPGGSPLRAYGPFADDRAGAERSLWWWHYQSSKRGVVVDLTDRDGAAQWRRLVAASDVVLEGEAPGRLAGLGVDHPEARAERPGLIWVSITPFGRDNPRAGEPATDLTLLAGGGPVWSCGYDDHTLPPVRGGGNQAMHTAGLHAVAATLVAVLHQRSGGPGQHIDVSMHAAANVTTEAATYHWLVARETVQRQTGRHASHRMTQTIGAVDCDGRPVNTGFPPTTPAGFGALLDWLEERGLTDELPEAAFLRLGIERGGVRLADIATDEEAQAIFGAARDALLLLARRMTGYEFFVGGQRRGLAVGVINAPEDVMEDPHMHATGFPTPVHHEDRAEPVIYPGSGLAFERTPWRITRRAPHIGEHDAELLHPLDP